MSLSRIDVVRDAVTLDVPNYLHLLTGHYIVTGAKYCAGRRQGTNDWLLTATVSGRGRFGSGEEQFDVGARELVLIRPWTRHDYGAVEGADHWDFYWAHFHPRSHWHDWLAWQEHTPGLMRLTVSEDKVWKDVKSTFRRAHECAAFSDSHNQSLAMHALEGLLLACQGSIAERQSALDERITRVLQIINGDLSAEITVPSLASEVALSPSRFAHLFREEMGMPPMQYLDQQRIQRAKQLLERTTNTVAKIAEEVGFEPLYFSNRFKQQAGLSPRDYRNRK